MPVEQPANQRQALRRELKRKRLAAADEFRSRAAKAIAANLWKSRMLARKRDIAIYLAVGGEVDCEAIVAGARLRNLRIFAPVIAGKRLNFAPLETTTKLRKNRFSIEEPVVTRKLMRLPQQLDAVIVPLLGFDNNGNRIGMGGGYYDRSFHFLRQRVHWAHPRLIGFAYESQCVESLVRFDWDVPLDAVVTEYANYIFPV
jgi:5-formyltetrahydrofolate cyclo-ligase